MRLIFTLILFATSLFAQQGGPVIIGVFAANQAPLVTALSPNQYGIVVGTGFGPNPTILIGGSTTRVLDRIDLPDGSFDTFRLPPGTSLLQFQLGQSATLGTTSVAVRTTGGQTSPAIPVQVRSTSPALNTDIKGNYFFNDPNNLDYGNAAPVAGSRLYLTVDGLGARPVLPSVQIDGAEIQVFGFFPTSWTNFGNYIGQIYAAGVQIPQLAGGQHVLTLTAGGVSTPPITFTSIVDGLATSQSGLTFNALQGGNAPPVQNFVVLSGSGTLTYSIDVSTVSGGGWLTANPASGTATANTAGANVQVRANPAGLAAGTYYGQVRVAAPGVPNSPQTVTVVLVVSPANAPPPPQLDKTGLVFTGAPGGPDAAAQQISIFNPASTNVTFLPTFQVVSGNNRFRVTSTQTTVAAGQSTTVSLQATFPAAAETDRVNLVLTFNNGVVRRVSLLQVVAAGSPSSSASTGLSPAPTAGCAATKLLPVFTLLGDNFAVPAAWPAPIEVAIVDDCGLPLNAGIVAVSFSNGDPVLRMRSTQNGRWAVTWPPLNARASGIAITVNASQDEANLKGSAQLNGGVSANPVPVIADGGVVETATYQAAPAPGSLISIFGSKLTSTSMLADRIPLPSQLGDTSAILGGETVPLIFTSDGQVNAVVPYSLAPGTRYQLVVQRGTALSVPQSVVIATARPAVFSVDGSGSGQGHIYKFDAKGAQILASPDSPALAGDVLVIYCSGLGAVTPPIAAGVAAPLTSLTKTVNPVTATIQGLPAEVQFAGLTPGSAGLYQVNLRIPANLIDSDATALVLTVAGQASAQSFLAVRK